MPFTSESENLGLSDSTSTSLLEQIKARDPDGWRRLARMYGPLLYHWCRHWGVPPVDAADVVQEVFLAVFAHIAGFRRTQPGDAFRAWLWSITRNKVRDHFRRDGPTPEGGSELQRRLSQIPFREIDDTSTCSAANPLRHALEMLRCEFEERTWTAFYRVAVGCQRPADVADELGMTAIAVRKAKSRVLRRLRDLYAGLFE